MFELLIGMQTRVGLRNLV